MKTFFWFTGPSLNSIIQEMDDVRRTPGARMEVHLRPRPGAAARIRRLCGSLQGYHAVIRFVAAGYTGTETNESHICPFDCPNGG